MGSVYKAAQVGLDRMVAIKVLHRNATADKDSTERFLREGRNLSKLSHPNIVSFLQFGFWNNRPFFVMELVNGQDLAIVLTQESRLPWKRSLGIAIQICEAMEYAHQQNIISRDLKPQNIMLAEIPEPNGLSSSKDLVKIIDFGLSRLSESSANEVEKLTKTGLLIGSIKYMSPEQCKGQTATKQSDIYSLGCVLYELLTGQTPLLADSPIGLLHRHVHETPERFSLVLPGESFPEGLEKCVFKAMEKKPSDRYQTMQEFADDLNMVLNDKGLQISANTNSLPSQKRSVIKKRKSFGLFFIGLGIIVSAIIIFLFLKSDSTVYFIQAPLFKLRGGEQAASECFLEAEKLAKGGHSSSSIYLVRTALSITDRKNEFSQAVNYCRAAEIASKCSDEDSADHWIIKSLKCFLVFKELNGDNGLAEEQLIDRICSFLQGRSCKLMAKDQLSLFDLGIKYGNNSPAKIAILELLNSRKAKQALPGYLQISVPDELASTYIMTGASSKAIPILLKQLKTTPLTPQTEQRLAHVSFNLARAKAYSYFANHEFEKAAAEFETATDMALRLGDLNGFVALLDSYSLTMRELNKYHEAQLHLSALLKRWEKSNLPHNHDYAYLISSKCWNLLDSRRAAEAKDFLLIRLAIEKAYRKTSDWPILTCYMRLSDAEWNLGNAGMAQTYANSVIAIARNKSDVSWIWATAASRVSEILYKTKGYEAANEYLAKFTQNWDKQKLLHNDTYCGYIIRVLCGIYIHERKFGELEALLRRELSIYGTTKIKDPNSISMPIFCHNTLALIYERQNRIKEASEEKLIAENLLEREAKSQGLDAQLFRRKLWMILPFDFI